MNKQHQLMKRLTLGVFAGVLVICGGVETYAQVSGVAADAADRNPAANKKKKTTKTVTAKRGGKTKPQARQAPKGKKITVGDMMRQRGASTLSIQKSAYAIPEAQKPLGPPKPLYEIKPPRSGDIFRESGTDEEKLEQYTDAGINQLYNLTQKHKDSSNRGELWLRLAELYVEKAKFVQYRQEKKYDAAVKLFNDKKGPKPKYDSAASKEYNLKAIKLYEWFLRDYPKDPKVDQALFFLGYNYVEMDQVKKGVYFYEKLTKEHPSSPYVGEAYFALGEYYFDNNKWAEGLKHYSDVLRNKRARLYSFALYKVAWCQYRLGRTGQGIKTLEEVINQSRAQSRAEKLEGRKAVNRIRLGSEALKDIVLFYAEDSPYEQAPEYFMRIGGDKAQFLMLEKLAYIYSDTGKRDQAAYIFKYLLAKNPTAPKAFDYQFQIVTNYSTSKNQKIYRDELYTWIDNYGPDSEWAQANRGNPKLLEDSYTLREQALRNYTLGLHRNAQNNQLKPSMQQAKDAYERYIAKFADSPKVYEMHFYFAEVLYDMHDYEAAGREYRFVADRDPKGKFHERAVLNSLLSLEKSLKSDDDIKQMVGESQNPVQFGEAEKAFMAAAERYYKTFPNGEKTVDVEFKTGRLFYAYNQYDQALLVFRRIVERYPRTRFAVYSANLILDIYNLRKDYDGLSREGTKLSQNRALVDQGFDADIKDVVEKASFKKAQDLETSKDYLGSAKAFADFTKNHPRSQFSEMAAYNSGINYERSGHIPEAVAMYGRVSRGGGKGDPKIRNKTMLLSGRLFEQMAQYDKAAVEYERYAKDNPKDKVTPDLYFNLAIIYEGQKEYYKAMNYYEKYYETSRRRDRASALYSIAKIHEKMGHIKPTIDAFEKYLNAGGGDPEKQVESVYRIAELNLKRGKAADAEKGFRRVIAMHRSSAEKGKPVGIRYAAEARFSATDRTYTELISIRIPANPQKQAQAVKDKLALITRLSAELAEVIKYDDANLVTASLTRLGQAYEHMSKAIWKAPLPAGLTPQELDAYKKGVDSVAKPLEQKAIENYKAAVAKSYEINAYSKWTNVALKALAQYEPANYSEAKDAVLPLVRTDDAGAGT